MNSNLQKTAAIILLFLTAGIPGLFGFSYTSNIDWYTGYITVDMEVPLTGRIVPSARADGEAEINRRIAGIVLNEIKPIFVDSSRTVESILHQDPGILPQIGDLTKTLHREHTYLSRDLSTLHARYVIPFFPDLVDIFVTHTQPYTPDKPLAFVPSASFSGLVIYVDQVLPLYGKHQSGGLHPALLPTIYDEDMNVVIEAAMVDPEVISRRGMVLYTPDPADRNITARAGQSPLYTVATGIFGKKNTDIIIPNETARRLLGNRDNHDIIKNGNLVIIANLP